ncbi:ATP-dependent DNA helicase [Paenalcaligenes niemegkensis]|uniref:ATP-dependent DNA helicase n=1 Tax=Paenalcaligenes niemegkensis TaxID=2895469 RepID=UPI001EE808AD|nr:ATP-dependent DNA helicase [Paenalcaligenes niemegkensis]MCQ9616512.1 ATP-dependent DNA helicase [Paenalcaligenes niemegkensis]
MKQLAFPFTEFRYGQRELAIAVYRNTKGGAQQLLEAPTGMGKTLGVLFPALKAISSEQKIFFLTAKNSGKRLATEALLRMDDDDRKATGCRTLELASKQQLCKYPDKACHGDDCPLAKGFYDRLADARRSALEAGVIDEFALVKTAAEHDICPYYLSLALIRWSDVVVADYNHYFDFTAVLHAYTQAESWSPVVVVDEGHNLVDRARSMYSASLSTIQLLGARKAAPKKLKSVFSGLIRALTDQYDELASGTTVIDSIDADVGHALNDVCIKVGAFVADEALPQDSVLLRCYFDILYFQRLYELFGMHSMADVQRASNDTITLTIRNVVPAPFLEERLNDAHSVTIFSATLRPAEFYKDLLGLNEKSSVYGALSPFKSEQLTVRIATDVSTRYQDRKGSIAPICEQVIRTHAEHPGNYLFFLSSFEYVEQVRSYFMREHPQLTIWTQTPGMSHIDRNAFLRNFHASNTGIGLAVLGGVFSEGVDLPGDRLIGAFIATLGLPQINPINEAYKERVSQIFGPALAYDYTYLYPGIRKVVQAAGRVIRTENDKGTLYLLDNRYAESRLRGLLPSWWEPKTVRLR